MLISAYDVCGSGRSFLRRCFKLGYRNPDSPDLDSLFSDADEQLFERINHNSQHNYTAAIFTWPSWFPTISEADITTRHSYARLLSWMKEILLLDIYTNIVTNRNGTCSYIMTLYYDSVASISFILSILYISINFSSCACQLAFTEMMMMMMMSSPLSIPNTVDLCNCCSYIIQPELPLRGFWRTHFGSE